MSRVIKFDEVCRILNDSVAVILDHSALSYPYVDIIDESANEIVYNFFEINYSDEYKMVENTFYPEDIQSIVIDDNGNIKLTVNDEEFIITVLTIKQL